MKISLLYSFLVVSFTACAQGKEDKTRELYETRKICQRIDNLKGLTVIEIDDSEEFLGHATDNGGSLKGFYKGDTLVKMVEWVGLSNREVTNTYYLHSGQLVFVGHVESKYGFDDSAQTINPSKKFDISYARYYFRNGKLMDAIAGHHEKKKSTQEDGKTYLESAADYRKLLEGKRKGK